MSYETAGRQSSRSPTRRQHCSTTACSNWTRETIVPAVQALGRRHAGYGVRAEHYESVGVALLWTLEQGLGEAFSEEAREAWATAYGTLASVMIGAADDAEREAHTAETVAA